MTNPLSRIVLRAAYGSTQLPRVAWYIGHGLAMRRLAKAAQPLDRKTVRTPAHTDANVPDRRRLYSDMAVLLRQDLANVEAGIYPLPADHDGPLLTLLQRSRLFFEDLPEIHRRRERGGHSEVLNEHAGKRPRYYLQNFHFQSGGWMTDESATRYDTQVEVLFNGMANATRRQALPQLHEVIAGRDQRKLSLLDIGCGTGRFLDLVKQVWPRLPSLGLDLSEPYVRHAKGHLRRRSRANLLVGNAESIPFPDASFDLVTSIFMFHELPPAVRQAIIGECARVMKPGGRLVLVDSLQRGDEPDYEGLLDLFPKNYHEPYYASNTTEDFRAMSSAYSLRHIRDVKAFVSKVMVFDKPEAS
jgi:ubiquinone/menaquinone biosynthesis C-methylase UbiE